MKRTMIAIVMLLTLTGCDLGSGKFEIVSSGNRAFLLNKATGDAQAIEGNELVVLKPQQPKTSDDTLKTAKTWPEQGVLENSALKVSARTKWRDGKMFYEARIFPYAGVLEREYKTTDFGRTPRVVINLVDSENFPVGEVELKLRSGPTRIMNDKGETEFMQWQGSVPMSSDSYRAATALSVTWSGFSKEKE